ncbi:MAG: hypothetical protein IH872_08905 [Chloroflexi bacterium]|nr:hypothetical protein [Chloroflexota bacterium]
MKVLKGEVSRTLVDLRALLMREDSPLMSGGFGDRAKASGDRGAVTQITLAPVDRAPTVTASIAAPGPPNQGPTVLAGLPDLENLKTPEAPGPVEEIMLPSLEPESAVLPTSPLADAPSAGDFSLPDAPSAGEFSLPDSGPGAATQKGIESEDEQEGERLRLRKARLQEEESLDEAERALRARRDEVVLPEQAADQEAGDRRKKLEREEDGESETGLRSRAAAGPVGELKIAQLKDAENDERLRQRKARLKEEQSIDASERSMSNRKRERQQLEEQAEQVIRERRKKRAQEEDEELENRGRNRRRERAEEEDYQDSRDRKMDKGPGGGERLEWLERLGRLERLESLAAESRKSRDSLEDKGQDVGADHWDRDPLPWPEADEQTVRRPRGRNREESGLERSQLESLYESGSQDEIDYYRRVRGPGKDLEEEMESFSESNMSEGDWGSDRDTGPGLGRLDQGSNEVSSPIGPGPYGTGLDDVEDEEFGPGDGLGIPGSQDQNPEHDLEFGQESVREGEMGDGPAGLGDDNYSEDWENPTGQNSPQRDPLDNYDSHEIQEGHKINGNKGSRRPKGPEAGRRMYEGDNYPDGYYQDNYYDDRSQEYGRTPQSPSRTQRAPRPAPRGPMGRRPPAGNYGHAPNGGNRGWPPGNEQWPSPRDWAPEPPPMDLNLVSNLIRWASMAKYRVGEKRLSDIIELYVESRSAPPGLGQALTHIASIVDDQPPESGQMAQETMDLIAHLHGILAAGLQVPPLPQIQGQISFTGGKGSSGGNGATSGSGNGDW